MYLEGKHPARPNSPPWNMAEKMFMRMTVTRVMTRNSFCQVSESTLTSTRAEVKRITTKHKDHSSLGIIFHFKFFLNNISNLIHKIK